MNLGLRLTLVSPAIVLDKVRLSQLGPRGIWAGERKNPRLGLAARELKLALQLPVPHLALGTPSTAPVKTVALRPPTDGSFSSAPSLSPSLERETGGWPTRSARDRRVTSPATMWRPPTLSRLKSEYATWTPARPPPVGWELLSWAAVGGLVALGPSHILEKGAVGLWKPKSPTPPSFLLPQVVLWQDHQTGVRAVTAQCGEPKRDLPGARK